MQFTRVIALCIMIILTAVSLYAANYPHVIQARLFFDSKDQWFQIKKMHLDEVSHGKDYVEIITDQAELTRIQGLGLKTETVHDDVTAFYRSRMPNKSMGAYKTLSEIYYYLDTLIANHPSLVSSKVDLGLTYNSRHMWAVRISNTPNVDNGNPEVLYTACIHAREVITPEVLIHFINYLISNYGSDSSITALVDSRQLWFVLVVNPDGYAYNEVINPSGGGMWRKNRFDNGDGTYGIDLNRNYGYQWGIDDEGSSPVTSDETYRGTGAFSELETQHMRDFELAHHFVTSIYFHSYAGLVLWPWGYAQSYTPDDYLFSIMGDSMAAMNSCTPEVSWGLYLTNGGSDDWGYGEQTLKQKTFPLTIEVGNNNDGFWPAASRIPQLVAENLGPCLFLARSAGNIYRLLPPNPPTLTVPDTVAAASYDVNWSLQDTLNPPVQYELTEMTGYKVTTDSAASFANWISKGFLISENRYSSAPYSFYSDTGNNLFHYIQSVNLYHVLTNDTLKFRVWYYLESDWDYGYVEVSTDGTSFTPIAGNITTTTNPHGTNLGNGYTGYSSGWLNAKFPLTTYSGQDIYLRFSYHTDQGTYYEGIYLDNIGSTPIFTTTNVYSSLTDTTKHFGGYSGGDYYYKVRAQDAEGQWSNYSNRGKTFVIRNYVCGDANGDSKVNVGDAVFVINYVFKSGLAPNPLQAGDANCDTKVNVGDAVYLINYVFKGGAAPCCP